MHAYLIPGLKHGPLILRRLIRQIPEARWDEPSPDDRFSPREVIAHLADWEPIMLGRLKTGVDTPGATVEVFDEGARALELRYHEADMEAELDKFEQARAATVRYLEALEPAAYQSRFQHPERGEMSVDDQANMLLGHELYHIEQLTAFLGEKVADVW